MPSIFRTIDKYSTYQLLIIAHLNCGHTDWVMIKPKNNKLYCEQCSTKHPINIYNSILRKKYKILC